MRVAVPSRTPQDRRYDCLIAVRLVQDR
jgi:hypothetical protein